AGSDYRATVLSAGPRAVKAIMPRSHAQPDTRARHIDHTLRRQARGLVGRKRGPTVGRPGRRPASRTLLLRVPQKKSHVPSVGSCPTPGLEKSHTPLGKMALDRKSVV